MPFRLSDTYPLFGDTPVENLFLEEYMPGAPGDFVKVYLCGLRQCYHPGGSTDSPEAIARALNMEEGAVRDAFAYWERQGVVRRVSDRPPTYQYNNLKALLLNRGTPEGEAGLYNYREFNSELQKLFGARLLKPAEYTRASEWVEELGLSQEAALAMVRLAIAERGTRVTFPYLDKMAISWAQAGVCTAEAAQDYVRAKGAANSGARKVLQAMGQRRAPTVDEERLYQGWLGMGFSHEAILAALPEMTRTANPNFAYFDRVLQSAKKRGTVSQADIVENRERREERSAPVREVLAALGLAGGITEDLLRRYDAWRAQGFDHEAILRAAEGVKRFGRASMEAVGDALARYAQKNLFTGAQVEAHAAEIGREREAAGHGAAPAYPRRKEVSAQKFTQRAYSEQELDALALDLTDLEGDG